MQVSKLLGTQCIDFIEQGNLMRSSVFRNANPSNLRGSLLDTFLEGNKDHLLSQARSDLAKRELHIESLNKCIGEQRRQTEEQRLALQDAQYGFVEYRRKQVRPQEECFSRTKSKIPKSELPKRVHRMNGCGLTTKPVRTSTLSDGATNSHIVRNMIRRIFLKGRCAPYHCCKHEGP